MIEVMPESQGKVFGVKMSGKITAREYEDVIIPGVETVLQEYGKVRFMYLLDESFQGAEAGAMWDDTKLGLKHRNDFEKMGVLGGPKWVDWSLKIGAMFIGGELKNFPADQRAEALRWVKS